MSKVKIYKSKNGENYVFALNKLIKVDAVLVKLSSEGSTFYPLCYSVVLGSISTVDFPTESERDAAFDELTALLEQAKKQLAEQDAKKSEIEAAKELLKDGKRVEVINIEGINYIIFRDQLIPVSGTTVGYIEAGGVGFHRFYANGREFYYYTHKKAERMWSKLTDHLARAKAQLLLEEAGE